MKTLIKNSIKNSPLILILLAGCLSTGTIMGQKSEFTAPTSYDHEYDQPEFCLTTIINDGFYAEAGNLTVNEATERVTERAKNKAKRMTSDPNNDCTYKVYAIDYIGLAIDPTTGISEHYFNVYLEETCCVRDFPG